MSSCGLVSRTAEILAYADALRAADAMAWTVGGAAAWRRCRNAASMAELAAFTAERPVLVDALAACLAPDDFLGDARPLFDAAVARAHARDAATFAALRAAYGATVHARSPAHRLARDLAAVADAPRRRMAAFAAADVVAALADYHHGTLYQSRYRHVGGPPVGRATRRYAEVLRARVPCPTTEQLVAAAAG
jgi:hypothetical protein